MRKVAIIGGKLQGLEAVYLASKAGIETVLIDKRQETPASALCDRFICSNVLEKKTSLIAELMAADFVLPALENKEVLIILDELSRKYGFKLAFDLKSYLITSSKLLSDKLMADHNIPAPKYYPNCKAPYIVKPSSASGSEGVRYIESPEAMEIFLKGVPADESWVAQEFLSGRSYSIEVIGKPGNYKTYEVTEIHMDEVYDCKRVTAPCDITHKMKKDFAEIGVTLATILKLEGIMDVEVIADEGELKVLEIDARIPSQTPTVVYHATGINLIKELADLFCEENFDQSETKQKKQVSFEHLLIKGSQIRAAGEHVISQAGPLKLIKGFCGADEVLTDYIQGAATWRGTFINSAETKEQLDVKRKNMLKAINLMQGEGLEYIDLSPSLI